MNPNSYWEKLESVFPFHELGKITKSSGLLFEAYLPRASVGSLCHIYRGRSIDASHANDYIEAEVVGFRERFAMLMPFGEVLGINNGSCVMLKQKNSSMRVSNALLGRIIDAQGNPMDGKGPLFPTQDDLEGSQLRTLYQKPADPLTRTMISQPMDLGVKSLNGLLTVGKGQRIGIMAGSGVGKSVLLGMMARNTAAQVNVIALIGERGREVREFIERDLGPEGLARSVVVVATSDSSPLNRMRGAFLATTIAEYFRDQSQDVLLMMDSVTRFCMAQREIGLSLGEPPASKGYTPSVFSLLPKLLERAGTSAGLGSITGIFTVLVEGDDMDEPIADAARSILDGHIVLTRRLAERNHFPSVDILQSTSRVMMQVISQEHRAAAAKMREWMALYAQVEDLINIGAYVRGSNARVDQAVAMNDRINQFLRQDIQEVVRFNEAVAQLQAIVSAGEAFLAAATQPAQQKSATPRATFSR